MLIGIKADAMEPDEIKKTFGARVRSLRQRRGWSQEELAEAADLDRTHVGKIERGQRDPGLVVVVRLADALSVSPGELIHPSDGGTPTNEHQP